ncbi:vicilin-like seed storage protein At2g18540 isoform X2 [Magnolia sinica]|uniref:vicilin-like seed storage protein At2g18540 isoform X2 n=1 Tax=Magnolia sinica TaxID=86752 RepID=UPI0026587D0F|nr:vicilin-like seed storage protein At2g18540 isoform X2 [Magnolia sinica]
MLRNHSLFLCFFFVVSASVLRSDHVLKLDPLVTKEERRTVALTDSGQISAIDVNDGYRGPYHIQFITMEPNSLFLPVLLQADMVFYVHTGRGMLEWVDDKDMNRLDLQPGDVYRLESGSVFYVHSHANPTREKLRIDAFFTNRNNESSQETYFGAYSTLSDLVLGFDKRVLQMAFKVSSELIEEIMGTTKPTSIIRMPSRNETDHPDWRAGIIEAVTGGGTSPGIYSRKKGTKAFNILRRKPDFENCNGWSVAVNGKDFRSLKGSDIGVFMVNLTKGSMMAPHWNPRATEVAIVTHGQGMVRIVCSSDSPNCQNSRFRVKEGDVFVIPRFHPMAQISFNNDSLVFMGFSTMARNNRPQFFVGKRSVFQAIDVEILAMSFNVNNATVRQFIDSQQESLILECASCAEEEEKKMEEEDRKKRQEEEEEKRDEEAKRREEEEREARKREEEQKQRQEEEARREEEEEAKRQEEEKEEKERQERQKREEEEEEEEARRRKEEERGGGGGGEGRALKKIWKI